MFKKFGITCDEAALICTKSQYKEASLFEKLKLNWHFLQCVICKVYSNQNNKMTVLFKIKATDCKQYKNRLSKAEKEKLAVEFKKMKP